MTESVSESSTAIPSDLIVKKSMKILHVDDDPSFLRVAKQCLAMQGEFQVETASSVEEAIERTEKEDFAAIVSDFVMPGKDGLEFLRELRTKGSRTPFFIFTGKGREEVAVKALNLGADGYFNKMGEPETVYGELAHGIRQAVERKTADMKIWEREERLRAVFSSSPDAITVSDLHGKILDCNEAAWKMLGFSSKEEVIGKSSFDFFAEKDRQKAYENLKKTSEQGTVRNVEYALLNKDGEEVWGELSASIIKDSSGNPSGFVGIIRDITVRKKTEKTLSKAMRETNAFRRSGIGVVGSFPWGTHLCQFYRAKDDLLETLVPYFSEGLRNNEYCMWVTSEPLGIEEAKEAMRKAVPDFDRCLERGQIEIIPHTEWYLKHGVFNSKRVLDGWINRLNEALAKGYDGLRLTGNTFWLEKKNWDDFVNYEKMVNSVIEQYKMIAICTYCLDKCGASEVIDVVSNHQFALVRESGEWKIVESSELKNAREEVGRSGEILRDVFACSPDAITVIDLNGKIVECNQKALDLLGYSSKDELIGRNGFALVAEKDRERAKGNLTKVLDHGSMKNIEYIALTKDGTEFSAELSASVLKDSSGNPMGFVSITKDVTERKKAEREIRIKDDAVASSIGAVAFADLEGNLSYVNDSFLRTWGYANNKEVLGRPSAEFWLSEEKAVEIVKALNDEGGWVGELTAKKKDGSTFEAQLSASLVKDEAGKPLCMMGSFVDVTSQKKAEVELRNTRNYLDNLLNYANAPIIVWDNVKRITLFNNAFEALTGHKKESMLGRNMDLLFPPLQKEMILQTIEGATKGEKWKSVEIPILCKDKETKIALWNSANITDEEGKIVATIAQGQDITERRESEEKFRSLVELAPDGIVAVNAEGIVTSVNRSFLTLVGYDSEEEIVGKLFTELKTSRVEDIPKFQSMFMSLMKGESPAPVEFLYVRRDGTSRWAEVHPSLLIKDGKPVGVQAMMRDVTERKNAEGASRDAKEKWASLTENTDDIVMIVDRNGLIQFINRTMPPYTPEETVGKTVYDYVPKEQHDVLEKALRGVFKTGNPDKYEVSSNIPAVGTLWFSTKIVPIKHDGKISRAILISANITDQKKAREENEKAAETWRTTFDSISDFVFVLDKDQRFVRVNKALCEALKKEPKELIGKRCFEVLHGTDKPWPNCPFRKTLVTKKATTEEVNDPNLGIPLLVTVSPIFDDEGVFAGVVHIAKDITERKKVEKDLRDSEERLRILFELAPDAYYLNDLKGNFIDGNKAAEEVTGYTKNELIGKSFLKLKLLPRSQVLKAAKLLAMNALGKPTGPDEFVLNRKDGTQVPVEIRTYPVRIKGKTLVLGIAHDITIRKKDEQAILESQQKFEGLFSHNPEATVYLDSDFRILDANPRFCQLFGYSAKEVEGKHINEVVTPEDMIEEAETLDKDAKKGYASRDTVRRRKDGSLVHVSISATPVTIEGRLFGYVGVYKDIANLKEAEERLKEMNKRLEVTNEKLHVVGGLTRHDVRNKLSAVTGNAYLLRRKLAEDPKALEQLNDMEAAVRLVERIFEFARIYEKLGTEQLVNLDVGEAVDGAVSLFSGLKGVKIVNECGGLAVLADSLLSQLFYNLIDNSLKYGEKTQQIRVYYKTSSANKLELVYEDDGVGIPSDMRDNLFKEGVGKGTGYGLFMIKRIIEVYGWTIRETGIQGKGVKFVITIPKTNPDGKENYLQDRER